MLSFNSRKQLFTTVSKIIFIFFNIFFLVWTMIKLFLNQSTIDQFLIQISTKTNISTMRPGTGMIPHSLHSPFHKA